MKQITLVRHAKSDWGTEMLKDVDRPLAERGYRDTYYAARWYAANKPVPDLLVSSTATRAFSTAMIFAREMELPVEKTAITDRIYEASADRIISYIGSIDDSVNHLMLFGHNPGFTNIANKLSSELFFDNLPTCGIVSFELDISRWSDISPNHSRLLYHQFPKDFRNKQ